MAGYIFLGTAAAFGVFCALWVMFGWMISVGRGGALVCYQPGSSALPLIRRYLFLRQAGLLHLPMLLIDSAMSPEEQALLIRRCPCIEFCSLEELPARLELERNRIG